MTKSPAISSTVTSSLDSRSQRDIIRLSMHVINTISKHVNQPVRLSDEDRIRCLRWLTWSRRHGIPLSYVIAQAFVWGKGAAKASVKFRRRANIFPLSVAAMTSKACYEWLCERIAEDFSDRPSAVRLRERMLTAVAVYPEATRGKLMDFDTIDAYADTYASSIDARRRVRDQAELLLSSGKPFRGNPFR